MDLAAVSHVLSSLPETLRRLAARGEPRRYRKSTLLIQEGDVGDTLYIVLQGRVKAFASDARGREIVYGVYGPGEYLGEMSLDGGPRSASVITLETTLCAVVTRATLREHIASDPEFAFELLARVIRRARLATQSARNMALMDVYGRLVQMLSELAVSQPDGTRVIAEKLTHQDIASRVGCSREMVSRLMKDLERGAHLARRGRELVLAARLPVNW
ncbi:MAG TPA: cyclic nucleotide-binding domain-containing protein [Rhizobacter sp.]|nr:cyclic nucleotide-binding domain-containing protein [Rhizobacter sp.]